MTEATRTFSKDHLGLFVLGAFTFVSIVGYGRFALHPENLPSTGIALRLYSISFQFFAQLHILIAFAVLATVLIKYIGFRWTAGLGAVCALSFVSEHVGTGYGIPFGGYSYTGLLGIRIGPRVPALIPLSWFLMSMPAWVVARSVFPDRQAGRVGRLILGSWGLVLWDLALDPAMSFLAPYWRWAETGPYYGMPWSNLLGWFVTGLVLMGALEATADWASYERLPARWMAAFYVLVLTLPLGMLAAAGAWLAVGTTVIAASCTAGAMVLLRRREGVPDSAPSPVGAS
jgi:putative membrane protein